MTITNLKELAKLMDLCRKKGVSNISVDGITLELGDAPTQARNEAAPVKESQLFEDPYSDEDKLFWSSTSHG